MAGKNIDKNKFITWINSILSENNVLSPETQKLLQIPILDEKEELISSKLKQQNTLFAVAIDLGQNFIMNQIPNVIRNQVYDWLTGSPILSDFNFWKRENGQGLEVIQEGKIVTNQRTGNIVTDVNLISPEPLNEIKVLDLTNQVTADQRQTFTLQEWATIPSAVSWLQQRINNLRSSIDQQVHDNLKLAIESYEGYLIVNIDPTGKTDEDIARETEKAIGENIANMSSGYTIDYSEEIDDDGNKLVGKTDPLDVGVIIANKASVNREVDYLRKQFKNTVDAPKDWGVGTIFNKQFEDSTIAVLAIAKNKLYWDVVELLLNTPLGFALIQNLLTLSNFWGTLFMLSGQSFKITISTPAELEAKIIGNFKNKVEELKNHLDQFTTEKVNLLKEQVLQTKQISESQFQVFIFNLKNQISERIKNLENKIKNKKTWMKKNVIQFKSKSIVNDQKKRIANSLEEIASNLNNLNQMNNKEVLKKINDINAKIDANLNKLNTDENNKEDEA